MNPASDEPHSVTRARRRTGRRWLLSGVGLLYVLSVPWYWEADANPPLWFGLPNWVTVALLCYAGAALLNAIAWKWTPVDDAAHVELGGGVDESR